jgi:predicted dehydrogenase
MALSAKQAALMELTARKEKKKLMMGFTMRFGNDARALKGLIEGGRLGDIYYAKAGYLRRRGVPGFGGWFTTKAMSGGGGLIDIGVHYLDLTLWLMGYPKATRVSGQCWAKFGPRALKGEKIAGFDGVGWPPAFTPTAKKTFDVDDLVTAFIRFDDGAILILEASWAANIDCDKGYSVIMGDKGGVSYGNGKILLHTEIDARNVDIDVQFDRNDGYRDEMRHFIDWVKGDVRETVAPARDGVESMRIIDAIYQSAREGKEVAVKY